MKDLFTPEERAELDHLHAILSKSFVTYGTDSPETEEAKLAPMREAMARERELFRIAEDRFVLSFDGDLDAILESTKEGLAEYTVDKFREFVKDGRNQLTRYIKISEKILAEGKDDPVSLAQTRETLKHMKEQRRGLFSYTYGAYRMYLFQRLNLELRALTHYNLSQDEFWKLVDATAAAAYPKTAPKDVEPIRPLQEREPTITGQLSLFENQFTALLNNQITRSMEALSIRGLHADPLRGGAAVVQAGDRHTITIENYEKLKGDFGVSAKKMLDAAVAQLTHINAHRPKDGVRVENVVNIDLNEYARAKGIKVDAIDGTEAEARQIADNKKELKRKIHRDLSVVASITHTWHEDKGRNAGDYTNVRIISSHSIRNGVIRINFDTDAARLLCNAYLMQYPTCLLRLDERNPNSYAIGLKIAYHNSNDNNVNAGTADTTTVKSLLAAAPEIVSYEELMAKGRRDWKVQIKAKLEKSLSDLVDVGYLSKWEYRDLSGNIFTADQASRLSWDSYRELRIDFSVIDAPDQTDRLAAKAEKAKARALTAGTKKKPRGRPRKNPV